MTENIFITVEAAIASTAMSQIAAQDLVGHRCINMRYETVGGLGPGIRKDGQELRVRVDGQITFNNSHAMIDAAVNSYGIAYVSGNIVERGIASGE